MLPALVAALILVGIHGYLGIHIIAREVIFVDLALAQVAALGWAAAGLGLAEPLAALPERVNLDISTISRVVNGKYVQTHFGVFELKYFFSEGIETDSGEEVSSTEVKNAVQDIVDNENKKKPKSDQAIADELKEKGFKVARRTVSKYREQLNIPVARLRKQII